MTRSGIVLAGTVILDIVNIVDHWPTEETVSFIQHTEYGAGGPPHNAAAGLAKLEAPFPVTLLGAVGDDSYGEIFLANARSYGLDTSHIRKMPGAVTSHTFVMSSAKTGKRTFFHQVGVSAGLDVADLLPRETNAKLFYAGSPGIARHLDTTGGWRRLLQAARDQGMKTCLELVPIDADIIRRHVPPCLPLCDYVVVNDFEADSVTGIKTTDGERFDFAAAVEACRKLLALGVSGIAAIHHPDGAVAVSASGEVAKRGSVIVPQGDIAGTVGAGDAFYAGMLFGIHEDWPLEKCLDLGNAAAATSLHAATTSAAIRPWTECLAYAGNLGLRTAG